MPNANQEFDFFLSMQVSCYRGGVFPYLLPVACKFLFTRHRVGLASAGLAVSKHRAVETLQYLLYHRLHHCVVYDNL
jgi:hypothetical protein